MKSSFSFDGKRLILRLTVEDDTERAMAKLLDALTTVEVAVERPSYASYSDSTIDAVRFTMTKPEEA